MPINLGVKVRTGNLFESDAQTLVNAVNTVGVMGKGIALEFKKRFPGMYEDYVRRCRRGEVKLGQPYLYRGSALPWVVNFPTKQHWRTRSHLVDIQTGLEHLVQYAQQWGIDSLAVPALGCGEGGLLWRTVETVLRQQLHRIGIPVEIYSPMGGVGGLHARAPTRSQNMLFRDV